MKILEMDQIRAEQFIEASFRELARGRAERTGTSIEDQLVSAKAELDRHLPQGTKTHGHFFYCGFDEFSEVAQLWFGIREELGKKRVFIFDISVGEQFRGKGYGKQLLSWLDDKTRELGLNEIGLHVIGNNIPARKLYEATGYEITNLYMAKKV